MRALPGTRRNAADIANGCRPACHEDGLARMALRPRRRSCPRPCHRTVKQDAASPDRAGFFNFDACSAAAAAAAWSVIVIQAMALGNFLHLTGGVEVRDACEASRYGLDG